MSTQSEYSEHINRPSKQHSQGDTKPSDSMTKEESVETRTSGPEFQPPPRHPDVDQISSRQKEKTDRPGFFTRAFSKDNQQTARHFFSAYAQTWVGLSPLWLAGEALTGRKVGTQFNKGRQNLLVAAQEIRGAVSTSAHDVVVIIDESFRGDSSTAARTAEVVKAAGENAILVVTSSLEKFGSHFPTSTVSFRKDSRGAADKTGSSFNIREFINEPALKQHLNSHGKDALVLLDKTLKHPVVITGVNSFARSKGIPHADALLRLASLGLSKIIKQLSQDVGHLAEEVGASGSQVGGIEELDAEELERRSTSEDKEEASNVGKAADGPQPAVENKDPYDEMRRRKECIIM